MICSALIRVALVQSLGDPLSDGPPMLRQDSATQDRRVFPER